MPRNTVAIRFGFVNPGERLIFREDEPAPTVYTKTQPRVIQYGDDKGRISEIKYREAWQARSRRAFCEDQDTIVFVVRD